MQPAHEARTAKEVSEDLNDRFDGEGLCAQGRGAFIDDRGYPSSLAEEVPECLSRLERLPPDDPEPTPPILTAALAHLQFETMHPFLDACSRSRRGAPVQKTAADVLGIIAGTVNVHIQRIDRKLEVHSKSEAVAKAIRNRIVPWPHEVAIAASGAWVPWP